MDIRDTHGKIIFSDKGTIRGVVETAVKANISLSDADFRGVDLSDADLRHAILCGANLDGAILCGANLSNANISDAILRGADLSAAILRSANLSDADLRGAIFNIANLSGADLSGADLNYTDLRGAFFRGATYGPEIPIHRQPLLIHGTRYPIMILDEHIKIGCQLRAAETWFNLRDDEIIRMDGIGALNWWRVWKPIIQTAFSLL